MFIDIEYAINFFVASSSGNSSANNLNVSLVPYPNPIWHVKSAGEIAAKTGLVIPIGVMGILLNLVILVTLFSNKHLLSPSNYLYANLAMADLFTLIFCPWLMLVTDLFQNFVLQSFGCRLDGFIQKFSILVGVSAVVLVSYDRLALISLTAEARITKKSAPRLIAFSWVSSAILATPWIVFREYSETEWLDFLEKTCTVNYSILGVYWYFVITMIVWLPLTLLVVTYITIVWSLNKSGKYFTSRGGNKIVAKASAKITKVTASVLLTAALCRLPYTSLVYSKNQQYRNGNDGLLFEESFGVLWYAANLAMYLGCALNPLIYGFTNPRWRRAMDRTRCFAWCKIGLWCCLCFKDERMEIVEKVFVIEATPRECKTASKVVHTVLRKDNFELSQPKHEQKADLKCDAYKHSKQDIHIIT